MKQSLLENQRGIRGDLIQTLTRELLGPFDGPEEVLNQRPTSRYLLGRLAPAGTEVAPEEDEGSADAGAGGDDYEAGYISPISMAMNPSSIGLSFTVDSSITAVVVTATWGTYSESKRRSSGTEGTRREYSEWVRREHSFTCEIDTTQPGRKELESEVEIQWLCRQLPDGKRRTVSVFLVNRKIAASSRRPDDSEWLFQPSLIAQHSDGAAVFQSRSLDDFDDSYTLDADQRADELLFRDRPEYAVGHGCAADWTALGGTGATLVRTATLPLYELARVDPRSSSDPGLDMRVLGGDDADGLPVDQLESLLLPLAEAYAVWVGNLVDRVADLDERLQEQANDHLSGCQRVLERIQEGIRLLCDVDDPSSQLARRAFCFANRAMALQRAHSVVALQRRRGEVETQVDQVTTTWRPFQLAFVLMNLPPLVDRSHRNRMTCDLLWFPTGGGKTEAYLGLTAFVFALRRIRPSLPGYRASGGVSVLMRYTLRLLTVQQFQRATALVCACEVIRLREGRWGEEPFSIGLWVGTSATPNQYSNSGGYWGEGAVEALEKWRDGKRIRGGTPAQLLSCPWCGAELGPSEYEADEYEERIKIHCPNDTCDFSPSNDLGIDGIPAHTVDEQVYRHTPSLVIATVDKFAQMAWNGRVQALFGRVQKRCERHGYITTGENHPQRRHNKDAKKGWPQAQITDVEAFEPPDLIIQDELHLISGPLGTLVGLYETAVDALASAEVDDERYPPKIIASTATIRRADQQVGSLFQRGLMIFPALGLDANDTWFGSEAQPEDDPGRIYLGIYAPGKSVKTALVRVYAALLSRAARLHESNAAGADAYMTLVSYFNSLRELGGAVRLAEDDVPGRIGVLAGNDTTTFAWRTLYERHELTSNRTAEEVPLILNMLERRFQEGTQVSGEYPVDVLFASNMISVGVDIDRLGLMVVNGQPKTTAEYIQATSRVGRQTPGLVITVYNWTRPRDLSHYERFKSYHTALYRHVEPTSVTPFSSRARDKGLAGILASLIRQGRPEMAPENAAGDFDPGHDWTQQVVELVYQRAAHAVPLDMADETRQEVLGLIDSWTDKLDDGGLPWSRWGHSGSVTPLSRWLMDRQEDRVRVGAFVAPGSLREVESEIHVYLLD